MLMVTEKKSDGSSASESRFPDARNAAWNGHTYRNWNKLARYKSGR